MWPQTMAIDDAVQECRRLASLEPDARKEKYEALGLKKSHFYGWFTFLNGDELAAFLADHRNDETPLTWTDVSKLVCGFLCSFLYTYDFAENGDGEGKQKKAQQLAIVLIQVLFGMQSKLVFRLLFA